MIRTESLLPPAPDFGEILRYMGAGREDRSFDALIKECMDECLPMLKYKLCCDEFDISVSGNKVVFPFAEFESSSLAKNLEACSKAVIFGATVGIGIDRLIFKYGHISPAKALVFQAIGAERIEALCDTFCGELKKRYITVMPRYSAGYGDLPLEAQTVFFRVLDLGRKIGVTLNSALLMSPSKSVTAIVGVG